MCAVPQGKDSRFLLAESCLCPLHFEAVTYGVEPYLDCVDRPTTTREIETCITIRIMKRHHHLIDSIEFTRKTCFEWRHNLQSNCLRSELVRTPNENPSQHTKVLWTTNGFNYGQQFRVPEVKMLCSQWNTDSRARVRLLFSFFGR